MKDVMNGIIFNLKGFIFIFFQFNIFLISGAGVTEIKYIIYC
jgi:hypothetical protein